MVKFFWVTIDFISVCVVGSAECIFNYIQELGFLARFFFSYIITAFVDNRTMLKICDFFLSSALLSNLYEILLALNTKEVQIILRHKTRSEDLRLNDIFDDISRISLIAFANDVLFIF